jgi:hypothetical protein
VTDAPHPGTYAALGWKVFPLHHLVEVDGARVCSCGDIDCDSPGKHPRTSNGVKAATSDLEQLRRWWQQFPGCNWALATGQPSGVIAIDLDAGKGGFESWAEYTAQRHAPGDLAQTLIAATGGGGRHLFLMSPPGEVVRNRVNWKPGVDIRGDGGYVVLAPSNHASGGSYAWQNWGHRIMAAPTDLLADLAAGGAGSSMLKGVTTDGLLDGIPEGSRDDMLFRLACRLRRQLGDNRATVELVVLTAAANSTPPFPEVDALKKIDQAFLQDHSDGGDPYAVGGDGFWDRRPELAALYSNARHRMLAPWGALGGAIQRALHTVPTTVAYRSDLGRAPLNTGMITVGDTGLGKGRTQRLLDDTLAFQSPFLDFDMIEVGSGEALVDAFAYVAGPNDSSGAPKGTLVWRDLSHARLVMFDEVGKLAALAARDGATIFEYLKSGLSGETIGRMLAGGRGVLLPKNQYRLGVTINVQPKVAWSLLTPAQIAGGLPGRFLWFSTMDPTLVTAERGEVTPFEIPVPAWPENHDVRALPEMDEAHDRDARLAHLGERDPMDGHALLARAKVAVGLMVLAGRTSLVPEDWELSAVVMEHSRATRARVLAELASEQVREEQRRARSAARTQTFTEDEKRKRDIERIAKKLATLKAEGVPQTEWRRRIRSSERDLYLDALAAMPDA